MSQKVLDRRIHLHRGPFTAKKNLESGRGLVNWGLLKINEEGL
jgi:hypothetical protein